MVAMPPALLPRSSILALCTGCRSTRGALRLGVEGLRALAREAHRLELRLALDLAWLKRRDPLELGYSSFGAMCRERVHWQRSWIHQLLRLVESPLDLVKRAAWQGLIPLRVAVRASGAIESAEQPAWLAAAVGGELEPAPGPRRGLRSLEGEEASVVRRARRLARLLIGRGASEREVDEFILSSWRQQVPAERLLERARTPPPAPPALEPLDPSWLEDPADELLEESYEEGEPSGSEPRSSEEALDRVERLQEALRGRRAVLARAWAVIRHERIWAMAGFASARAFVEEVLGVSMRTAQRMAKVGWALEWYPEVDAALRSGLSFGAVEQLAPVLSGSTAASWVAIAARVGRRELGLAVEEARATSPEAVCARYREALRTVDAWWEACSTAGGASDATSAGRSPPEGRLPRVALPQRMPAEEASDSTRVVRAPAELVYAGRWLLEQVHIAPGRGFSAVKTRDGHRCQNPECGRLSLCNQAHHVQFRSHGGTDALDNGVTVCRCCHLRGIHTGRIVVERVVVGGAEALLWRCGERVVVQLREPLPSDRGSFQLRKAPFGPLHEPSAVGGHAAR